MRSVVCPALHVRVVVFAGKRLRGLCLDRCAPIVTVMFRFACCLQGKPEVAGVTKLYDKCRYANASVTIAEIAQGAACCEPPHPVTAALFCDAMGCLAGGGGSAACDKIASANGIPVIVQLLARFPDDRVVVHWGSLALYGLAAFGSASIKSLIRAQPDIIALLRAASTRLQAWGWKDSAAYALEKLGGM
jgi:hypothetical protein